MVTWAWLMWKMPFRAVELHVAARYVLAAAVAGAAVALRWTLGGVVGTTAPYLTLFPVVLAAAILLGRGPGAAAGAIGVLATEVWLHRWPVQVEIVAATLRAAVVIATSVTIASLAERLRETRSSLAEAERRKDNFLAVLSHELRNPIGTIRSALSILEKAPAPPARDLGQVQTTVERQLSYLSRLVDDLLDVSRLKTGRIRIERHEVDLCDLVGRVVEDHLGVLADLTVDLRLPESPVVVGGDQTRLAQVLGNLLQNASKFTPPGGRVLVSLEAGHQTAMLLVRDNGLGLDEAVRSHLFEPFAQSELTRHRTRGGLGIGLALVKAVVELHGGRVAASSEGPGRGSEFRVLLPLADATSVAGADIAEIGRVEARGKRVLLIEDNRDFATMLQMLLELTGGHEVVTAESGPKGIELAGRIHPDVIVCDIGLPVMDGYEVARALRGQSATRDVPLVALTGYASVDDARRAAEAGFNHHIPKGGDPEAVVRLLAEPAAASGQ